MALSDGGPITQRAPLPSGRTDMNRKSGGAGAAAPPIIPIKRLAFDENENSFAQPTCSLNFELWILKFPAVDSWIKDTLGF